jgi:hypothetical protein
MKKTLLTGTALATAAMLAASPASAEIAIGAYMNWGVGLSDTGQPGGGGSRHGYGTNTNSEISFKASSKTDAGLEYGLEIQVEGDAAGIDERFMFVSGGFGKVTLGSNDGAADPKIDGAVYGVPGMAGAEDSGLAGSTSSGSGTAVSNNGLVDGGDNLMMLYNAPRIAGVAVSASYTPSGGTSTDGGTYQYMWGGNINTSHKFEGVGVKLNLSGVHADGQGDSTKESALNGYSIGAGLDYEGLGFEIGYMRQHDGESIHGGDDDTAFVIGTGYKQGPWTIGVQYNSTDENTTKDEWQAYSIGTSYNVAKGLTLTAAAIFVEVTDVSAGAAFDSNTVTGTIKMSF